jgi:hypothetical protein
MPSNISKKYTDQALKLQERYSGELAQVRGNSSLSAEGKQEALALI